MQSSVEQLSNNQKKIKVEFSAEEVDSGFKTLLTEIRPSFEMKGQRRGKVPLSVIEKRYGSYIPEQVKENLLKAHYEEITSSISDNIVSMVATDVSECKRGSSFNISFEVGVIPKIEVSGYEGIEIQKPTYTVEEKDIYQALRPHIMRNSNLVKIEDATATVEKNSIVEVSYKTEVETHEVGGLWCNEKEMLEFDVLADDQPCERCGIDFRKVLQGIKVGDYTVEVVTLPEHYKVKSYAGKNGECTITVNGIYRREVPAVDDEFSKKLGCENKEKLLADVRTSIESSLEYRQKEIEIDRMNEKLMELNPVDVPASYIDQEAVKRVQSQFGSYSKDFNAKEFLSSNSEFKKNVSSQVEKDIKISFIYKSIAEKEKIELTDKELSEAYARVEPMIRSYVSTRSEFKKAQERILPNIYQMELSKKIQDFLLSRANIVENKEDIPSDLLYYSPRPVNKEHTHEAGCECGHDHGDEAHVE